MKRVVKGVSEKDLDLVLDTVDDLVIDFLCDDRDEDDELPRGKIEEFVESSIIEGDDLIEVILARFREKLLDGLGYEESDTAEDEENEEP